MSSNTRRLVVLCCAALAAVLCGRPSRPDNLPASSTHTASFALELLERAGASAPDKNVALSPLSIGNALAVTGHGARGRTAQEFDTLLHLPVRDNPPVAARQLASAAGGDNRPVLVRSALWLPASLPVNPGFTPAPFDARVAALPDDQQQAVTTINAWIAEATHGVIRELVAPPIDTRAFVVTSTAYFKGRWVAPFNPNDTRLKDFLVRGGTPYKVPMMRQTGIDARYWSSGDLEAILLPFRGGPLDYLIVTSHSRAPAEEILTLIRERALAAELLSGARFELRHGSIEIPRHRVEFGMELREPLQQLGLRTAFSPAADFSGLSAEPLRLASAPHRALLVVDEAGAEAAGATAVGSTLGMPPQQPPTLNFIADRPFVALLVARDVPEWPVMVALIRSP